MKFFRHDNEMIQWLSERIVYVFFEILYVYLLFLLIRGHGTYFLLRISGSLIGITLSTIFKTVQENEQKTTNDYKPLYNLTDNAQNRSSGEEKEDEEEEIQRK